MMTCPNCKRTIKAVESVNGITAEVSANFCPGCGAMMPGTNYEADNVSCLNLCQSLFDDEWRVVVRAMPVMLAYNHNKLTLEQVFETLDLKVMGDLFDLRDKAIAGGVKLARGEE